MTTDSSGQEVSRPAAKQSCCHLTSLVSKSRDSRAARQAKFHPLELAPTRLRRSSRMCAMPPFCARPNFSVQNGRRTQKRVKSRGRLEEVEQDCPGSCGGCPLRTPVLPCNSSFVAAVRSARLAWMTGSNRDVWPPTTQRSPMFGVS